ncbi:hypothetical protein EMIT0196MI5_400002 [Pseudomonas sp. IT-196MI5]
MAPLPQRHFAAKCLKHSPSDYPLLDISQFKPTLFAGAYEFQRRLGARLDLLTLVRRSST